MSESPAVIEFPVPRQNSGLRTVKPSPRFGRDEILASVEAELRAPGRRAVVLHGPRRIGKTTLLLQLQQALPSPSFMPVYVDLAGMGGQPLSRILYELALSVSAAAGMIAPTMASLDDQGISFQRDFLPQVYRCLGEEVCPVLLLDQLDQLCPAGTRAEAAHEALALVRRLIDQERGLGFVFALDGRPEQVGSELLAILRGARCERVPALEPAGATALIQARRPPGAQPLRAAVVNRLLALSGGHPYLIQLLCENLAQEEPRPARELDTSAIDSRVARVLEAGESGLEWIWDGLSPAERVVAAAIAAAGGDGTMVPRAELEALLDRQQVPLRPEEVARAVEGLVEAAVLRQGLRGCGFLADLMRRFVAARKPVALAREELARKAPVSETLYLAALGLHQQNDRESARGSVALALRLDPEHDRARLLYGQLLLELGSLAEAVEVLEEAHRRTPEAARGLLGQALLQQAEAHEHAGDEEAALPLYLRLEEPPFSSAEARQRRQALWRQRGEQALAAGRLEAALVAFREAGAEEQAAEVQAKVEAARALAEQHQAGREALARGDRLQAARLLAGVVHARPDDRDAAALLVRALGRPAPEPAPEPVPPPRRTAGPLALGLALAVGVGLGAVAARRPAVSPRPLPASAQAGPVDPAAARLLEADAALLAQEWEVAESRLQQVLALPGLSPEARAVAQARQAQAERERAAQALYRVLVKDAAGTADADQLVHLYHQLPPDSIYRKLARPAYEDAAERFAREHLRRADTARTARRCRDFREHIRQVLAVEPAHPGALEAHRKACQEAAPRPAGREAAEGEPVAQPPVQSSAQKEMKDPFSR